MDCGRNIVQVDLIIGNLLMARFYRKPKPETMKKNRETYRKAYKAEIDWIKENLSVVQKHNKFLYDMYMILITGSQRESIRKELNMKELVQLFRFHLLQRLEEEKSSVLQEFTFDNYGIFIRRKRIDLLKVMNIVLGILEQSTQEEMTMLVKH